jgi:hypothetical protein
MWTALAQTLASALSIWDHKEKNKYIDKLISLKKDYNAEFNKSPANRSDAVLDNLEFELRLLCSGFVASAGKPDPSP